MSEKTSDSELVDEARRWAKHLQGLAPTDYVNLLSVLCSRLELATRRAEEAEKSEAGFTAMLRITQTEIKRLRGLIRWLYRTFYDGPPPSENRMKEIEAIVREDSDA